MNLALLVVMTAQTTPVLVDASLRERIRRVEVPVVYAGVLDLDTGELRPPSLGVTAHDVIYDNTCFQGYYAGLSPGAMVVDDGRVPGPTSPGGICTPGCATSYRVDAIEFAYVTENVQPIAVLEFFNQIQWCGPEPSARPPVGRAILDSLPGAPAAGTPTGWIVTVELGTSAFVMTADGDGVYHPGGSSRFGWSVEFLTTQGNEGPLYAGYPFLSGGCAPCVGTVWDPFPEGPDEAGTGLNNDLWAMYCPQSSGSCVCISSDPTFGGFHLELQSSEACPPEPGIPSCFGDVALCPCANAGFTDTGCENAAGTGGARLRAHDFAPDGQGGGTVRLEASNLPLDTQPAVVGLRSSQAEVPPVAFGDGLRCVGLPGLVRVGATLASNGLAELVLNHGAGSGSFHYQLWYRSLPASYCSPAGFNLSNAYALTW